MVDAFLARGGDVESAPLIADDKRPPPSRGMVGLVHQVPTAVVYQPTWGSLIEQAYLNTTHAKMYLSINNVAIESCVVGKSCMYSRTNIDALSSPAPSLAQQNVHGLAGFGPFMAEDNMLALSIWHELGLKHAMTGDVATDFLGALSVRDYFMRRARWIRVRKMMTLPATSMEPFTESIVASLYGAWAVHHLFGVPRAVFWVLSMGAWLCADLAVRRALATNVRHVGPPQPTGRFLLAWAARECLALPIWLYAMAGSRVVWRGKAYRVLASGEAKRLD
jgi:ceramide glucosyltransferase